MDTLYTSRISMAGWLFCFVFASAIWNGDYVAKQNILQMSLQYGKDAGGLMVAIVGALVGVGVPPAFGFLLDRITSWIASAANLGVWDYSCYDALRARYSSSVEAGATKRNTLNTAALFHCEFYSNANSQLIDWARRRRAHSHASWVGVAAVWMALLASLPVFSGVRSVACYAVWIGITLILNSAAVSSSRQHRLVVEAWIELHGNPASKT